jgi:hypothetical protein
MMSGETGIIERDSGEVNMADWTEIRNWKAINTRPQAEQSANAPYPLRC